MRAGCGTADAGIAQFKEAMPVRTGSLGGSTGRLEDSCSQIRIADHSARTVELRCSEPASSASILRHWEMPRAVAWHATGWDDLRSRIDGRSREVEDSRRCGSASHKVKLYAAGAGNAAIQNRLKTAKSRCASQERQQVNYPCINSVISS